MKKIISLTASLAIACTCAFSLAACGNDGANGKDGENGKDGINGSDGTDGKDGVSVKDAYIDSDGNLIIKLTDGKEINCGKVNASESLFYRPVIEDNKTVSFRVMSIGTVTSKNLVIPDIYMGLPVTGIDNNAFYNCGFIESVTIGGNITEIGESAFAKCENLKSVHADSVEKWCGISFANTGSNPMYFATEFYEGKNLVENLVIPDSVTEIPDSAFYECKSIKSVKTGSTRIGSNSFYGCENLESVTIEETSEMGELAFADCPALKTLSFGNEVEMIGEYSFLRCVALEEVTIPSSVKKIADGAFMDCEGMTAAHLNDGLLSIGECAFSGCVSLAEFNMPTTVEEVGFGVIMFGGNYGFGGVVDSTNQVGKIVMSDNLTVIPDFAFSYCGIKNIVIGDKVEKISYSSFYGCENLESAVIPKSVTQIESYAFYRCSMINTVYYEGTAAEWEAIKIGKKGNDILNAEIYYYSCLLYT